MNWKAKFKRKILKEIREESGELYAETCKPAIDEYLGYMEDNQFPSYLSEEEMYECLQKYVSMPPQIIFILKDGKIVRKAAKHNENHVVAVREFVKEYVAQYPDSSLSCINLERENLFGLMRAIQKEQIEMYYLWLDWLDCNTYCNIWSGKGEAPKRDMSSRMVFEELLQKNEAYRVEDDTYKIDGVPKQAIDRIVDRKEQTMEEQLEQEELQNWNITSEDELQNLQVAIETFFTSVKVMGIDEISDVLEGYDTREKSIESTKMRLHHFLQTPVQLFLISKDGEFHLKTGNYDSFHIDLLLDWLEENPLNLDVDELELLLQCRNQPKVFRTVLDHSYMIGKIFYDIEKDETGVMIDKPEMLSQEQEEVYQQFKERYLDRNGAQWLDMDVCYISGSPEYPLTENSFKQNKMM